jgi:hypothetical protein
VQVPPATATAGSFLAGLYRALLAQIEVDVACFRMRPRQATPLKHSVTRLKRSAEGLKAADLPVLATESGKKWWEFDLSSVSLPAFLRVCEDSVADGSAYWWAGVANLG